MKSGAVLTIFLGFTAIHPSHGQAPLVLVEWPHCYGAGDAEETYQTGSG